MKRSHLLLLYIALVWTGGIAQTSIQTARLSGRVMDLIGNPLPDTTISILTSAGRLVARTSSGPTGDFVITGLQPGAVRLEFAARGFLHQMMAVQLDRTESVYLNVGLVLGNLTTPPEFIVVGTIRGADAGPAPNATVIARAMFNSQVRESARADEKGHYRAVIHVPGQYELTAQTSDGRVGSVTMQIPGSMETVLTADIKIGTPDWTFKD